MNKTARLLINFAYGVIFLLLPQFAFAATFNVANEAQLVSAINTINASPGTTPDPSSNLINITTATPIVITANLPVLQNGVTIASTTGGSTINGNNLYSLIATYKTSVSLQQVTLSNGLALGGSGGNADNFSGGGGGGLGAGGGAYVDYQQSLYLANTTISGCTAQGGTGGNGGGSTSPGNIAAGGGGGASWTIGTKNGSLTNGGGDYPGLSTSTTSTGGAQAYSGTLNGYGGGNGGASQYGNAGGAGGGNGTGATTSSGIGAAGGYCGGGGAGAGGSGGGGGGNGGGAGPASGGGGGGYGSGGAGGQSGQTSGGGGGGLGGGGGGGTGGFDNGGGAGGGYGGGGGGSGGSGTPIGGSGGLFGGTGGFSRGGGGGGGAIAGGIFVGDSAFLYIGDAVTITPNANFLTAGNPGSGGSTAATAGSTYARDIFLFQNAQLIFNGSASQSFATQIQADQNTSANIDAGININLSNPASTITLTATTNNYRGGTTVTSGILAVNVSNNLPSTGNISTLSQGTLNVTGGNLANTTSNAGTLNITGSASNSGTINTSGIMGIGATFTNNNIITNSGTINNNATFTNQGTLENDGTLNLNSLYTGTGTCNNSDTGIININAGATFVQPTTFNNTGITNLNSTGNISGNYSGSAGSILTVGNTSSSNYSTSGDLTGFTTLQTIANGTVFTINGNATGGSNSTFDIGTGTTVNLNAGANVSNFNNIIIDGTYNILNGATYTLETNNNLSGSGTLSNQGLFYVNGNVSFSGSFANQATGTFTINGTPTLTFLGSTFTNRGNLVANFSSSNTLPKINATHVVVPSNLDLSHGVIIIGYNNNYIATGDYTLLNAGTPPVPGVAILPQNTFYISDWSLKPVGNTLAVSVTRDGFDQHALTPEAVQIGAFLEEIGQSHPNASQLQLLNALEGIQNNEELTLALLSLLPPQYVMLVTLYLQDQIAGALDIRYASAHRSYSSGDTLGNDKVSAWVRPISSTGTQTPNQELNGYTNKNHGFVLGFDRGINDWLTLGAAASYVKSTVNDTTVPNSKTNIDTYQLMLYSTAKGLKDSYIDALISGGVSNYHAIRSIIFPGFDQASSSNYTSQQLTLKVRASKIFNWACFWQFTPVAMAQYSFVRPLAYSENGGGSFNISVNPDNINLFRLGVGAYLGIPFTSNNMISIPSVYAMFYDDVKGGTDTTNSQFLSGGPIITNSVHSGRAMATLGAMYELTLNDHLQLVVNYDYVVRHNFKGTEGLLNFRYTF